MNLQETNHSNRLYNGLCTDLREALRLMIAQYRQEQQWIRRNYLRGFPDDGIDGLRKLEHSIASVQECAEEYQAAISSAEQALFIRWNASKDEEIARIGDAALAGDYSRLAL